MYWSATAAMTSAWNSSWYPNTRRERVRPAPRVDDAAERVAEPSGEHEHRGEDPGLRDQLREDDDADPAEGAADQDRQPPRRPCPEHPGQDRRPRAGPDDRQHDDPPVTGEHQQTERRVRAGDHRVDARVVEPAEPEPPRGRPGHAVVKGARAEHAHDASGEHGGGDLRHRRVPDEPDRGHPAESPGRTPTRGGRRANEACHEPRSDAPSTSVNFSSDRYRVRNAAALPARPAAPAARVDEPRRGGSEAGALELVAAAGTCRDPADVALLLG